MTELSTQASAKLEESILARLEKKTHLNDSGYARNRLGGVIGRVYIEVYTRVGTGEDRHPRFRRETNRRILLHHADRDETAQVAIYPDGAVEFLAEPKDPRWVQELLPSLEVPTRTEQ